jgi:hypothetical protein
MEHLDGLGDALFNYSIGENMQLVLNEYVDSKEMIKILDVYKHDNKVFGDVYCQFRKG